MHKCKGWSARMLLLPPHRGIDLFCCLAIVALVWARSAGASVDEAAAGPRADWRSITLAEGAVAPTSRPLVGGLLCQPVIVF